LQCHATWANGQHIFVFKCHWAFQLLASRAKMFAYTVFFVKFKKWPLLPLAIPRPLFSHLFGNSF
jgi:hypothetical protein